MKSPWNCTTKADRLVLLGLFCIGLAGLLWNLSAAPGQKLVVSDGDRVLFAAPLDQFREIDLEGPLGTTRLVVTAEGVQITRSPCPLKVCMRMGPAHKVGDLLACVPNHLLVQIEGPEPDTPSYDLLSR